MSDFCLDWHRQTRIGLAEAVLCDAKSPAQISQILTEAGARRLLLTRLEPAKLAELAEPLRIALDYCPLSRTAIWGGAMTSSREDAIIVSAGTSDLPVAREAARTLAFYGHTAPIIADVGVAGLWRLLERLDEIRRYRLVIAVAGMEGALFSVLGGLIQAPLIAVPTSVGYGVAAGGQAALTSALASCVAGMLAVNIDNGYGAACAALRILGCLELLEQGGGHQPAIGP